MLHAQLADPDGVVGRLLAVEALSKAKDKTSVEKLNKNDPFYEESLPPRHFAESTPIMPSMPSYPLPAKKTPECVDRS